MDEVLGYALLGAAALPAGALYGDALPAPAESCVTPH
jgi:hypothetical protein